MRTTTSMIPVDTATAAQYDAATEEERQNVHVLVRLLFRTTYRLNLSVSQRRG